MMKKYYHYTNVKNIENIKMSETLKAGYSGVYACDKLEDVYKFINLYKGIMNLEEVVIIEFMTNQKLQESFDHISEYVGGARAFTSDKDIKIKILEIKSLGYKYSEEERKTMELTQQINELRVKLINMEYQMKLGFDLPKEYEEIKNKHDAICDEIRISKVYKI